MLFYAVIILHMCCLTDSSAVLGDVEGYLQEYISIYKSRIFQTYTHCNLYFRERSKISTDIVNWFASKNGCPNMIINKLSKNRISVMTNSQGDFIFLESVEEARYIVTSLPKTFVWNEKGNAHIIISTKVKDLDFLHPTFRFLWEMHFVNYVIVFVYEKLEIFAFDAFRNKILNLTDCGGCPLFTPVMNNFWGYPLRVTLFQNHPLLRKWRGMWLGKDYEIITKIVKTSNVTLQITETENFRASAISLINNESDICFVSTFFLKEYELLDYSYPHHFNHLVAVVPSSARIPQYQNIFYILDKVVWIFLIITILGITLIVKIAIGYGKCKRSYWYCLLDVWRAFLQQGIWNLQKTYHKARPIIVLWFCFTLIFGSAFQTSLTSMFIKSKYFKDLDTISELQSSDLMFYVTFLAYRVVPQEYGLHHRFKVVNEMNDIHKLITNPDNFPSAYIMNEDAARIYCNWILDREDRPRYHIVSEKLVPGLETYLFQKKSPFINRLDRMLMLVTQFGLKGDWLDNPPVVGGSGSKNIGILHLQCAIFLLVLGYGLGILCFVFELWLTPTKQKGNK